MPNKPKQTTAAKRAAILGLTAPSPGAEGGRRDEILRMTSGVPQPTTTGTATTATTLPSPAPPVQAGAAGPTLTQRVAQAVQPVIGATPTFQGGPVGQALGGLGVAPRMPDPDAAARGGALGAQGFNLGVAQAVGMPVDIGNAALGQVGLGVDKPFLGSEMIEQHWRDFVDATGGSFLVAENAAEAAMENAGREVGAGLGTLATLSVGAAAANLARYGKTGIEMTRGLLADLLREPGRVAALEAMSAGEAGAIGGYAGHKAKERGMDQEGVQLWATLAAAIGIPAATTLVDGVIDSTKKFGTGTMSQAKAEQLVGADLEKILSKDPLYGRILDRAMAAFRRLGVDEMPGVGAMSGDPGAQQALARLEREIPGSQAEAIARTERIRAQAAEGVEREVAGQGRLVPARGTTDPSDLRRVAEGEQASIANTYDRLSAEAASDLERAELATANQRVLNREAAFDMDEMVDNFRRDTDANIDERVTALGRVGTEKEIGEIIQEELLREKRQLSEAFGEAYRHFETQYGHVPVDHQFALAEAKKVMSEVHRTAQGESFPGILKNIVADEVLENSATIPFSEARQLSTSLGEAITKAASGEGADMNLVRRLGRVKDKLDGAIEAVGETGKVPGLKEVNGLYRASRLRLSAKHVAEAHASGRHGRPFLKDPSEAGRAFMRAGRSAQEAAENFMEAFAAKEGRKSADGVPAVPDIEVNERGRKALKDFALGDLLATIRNPATGKVVPRLFHKWVKQHRHQLDQFPDLKESVGSVDRFMREVKGREDQLLAGVSRRKRQLPGELEQVRSGEVTARRRAQQVAADRTAAERDYNDSAFRLITDADPGREVSRVLDSASPQRAIEDVQRRIGRASNSTREDRAAAYSSLRRELWDEIMRRSRGSDRALESRELLADENSVRRVMEQYGGVLREAYGTREASDQLEVLDSLARVVGAVTPPTTGTDVAGRGITDQLLTAAAQRKDAVVSAFTSRAYSYQRGIISGRYLVSEQILKAINRETGKANRGLLQRVMREALYDPDVAHRLVQAARSPAPKVASNIRGFLVNMALRYGEDGMKGEEEQQAQ